MKKIAVVTGASRGLGKGTAEALAKRGYRTVFAVRDPAKLQPYLGKLLAENLDVRALKLDVSSEKSIDAFFEELKREMGHVDVLVNNAGIFEDSKDGGGTLNGKAATLVRTFETNTVGPFLLTKKILPWMKDAGFGRVVNVSSGMGQLSEMGPGSPAYRISKTALNAVTKLFSIETAGTDVLVNSVCPGWVKTDMGGAGAARELEQGVQSILYAALLPKGGPNGGFFRDGKPLEF